MSVNGIIVPSNGSTGMWEQVKNKQNEIQPKENRSIVVPSNSTIGHVNFIKNSDGSEELGINSISGLDSQIKIRIIDTMVGGDPNDNSDIELIAGDSSFSLSGNTNVLVGGIATPVKDTDAANKKYVDTKAPGYTYSTTDLTAGTSALETGKLYFVYEE